ncbi:hypothetical protein, partial [Paracoccus sp. (in: a-proteobacteria)]|uniref:hypothetical protein n=1 Tax=Paracoccus sp. TaxID=267 RepID=UPI002897200F
MTELIEEASRQNAAWIIRGELANHGRALRIELGPTDETAVAAGDWAVVIGSDDAVRIVGRILRVRSDTNGRTIYFDQALAVDPAVLLTALGLTAPSAPATRLPWGDFLRALPSLGAASPDAVPLIQDVTYVRDLLEVSVRDDLLGPAEGPHELIKDMSVRDRYLVGKLAPRRPGDDQAAQVEPASGADEAGDLEEERAAPLHEPGAEFPTATGRVEPEDDALDEIDTTNNQSLVPSSMGLTFCVAADVQSLAVEARWGRFERVPNAEHDITKTRRNRQTGREEQVKVKVWQRVPCGGVVPLPLIDGPLPPSIPDPDQPDVRLQGTVRTNNKGERVVTLFLVNGQLEPEDNKDSAWLFQPEITVEAPEDHNDKSVFR